MSSSMNQQSNQNPLMESNPQRRTEDESIIQLQRKLKEMSAAIKEQKAQAKTNDNVVAFRNSSPRVHASHESTGIVDNRTVLIATVGTFIITAAAIAAMIIQTSEKTAKLQDVASGRFQTGDSSIHFDIASGIGEIAGRGISPKSLVVKNWHGQWSEEFDFLNGKYDSTTWVRIIPQGFETETGVVVYENTAPEMSVITLMNRIRDESSRVYKRTNAYPQSINDLGARCMIGDQLTGKQAPVTVSRFVGAGLTAAVGKTQFESDLELDRNIGAVEQKVPFQVKCINVSSEPKISADLNSYGWLTEAFFIQGLDRDGQLIRSSKTQALTLVLKNGHEENRPTSINTLFGPDSNKLSSITFYSGDKPSKTTVAMHYASVIAIGFLFVFLKLARDFHRRVVDSTDQRTTRKVEPALLIKHAINNEQRTRALTPSQEFNRPIDTTQRSS